MIEVYRKRNPDKSIVYWIPNWMAYLAYLDGINQERPWNDLSYTLTIGWDVMMDSEMSFEFIDRWMMRNFYIRPGDGVVVG